MKYSVIKRKNKIKEAIESDEIRSWCRLEGQNTFTRNRKIPCKDLIYLSLNNKSKTTSNIPETLTIPANPIAQNIRTVVLVTDTTPPLFISLITSSVGVPVNPVIVISNPDIKDVNPSTILNP